jgi:hypothetical protein
MRIIRLPMGIVLVVLLAANVSFGRKVALLDVSNGQIPNDTGSDGLTKMTIEDCPGLGGQALKVVYHSGDSFGDRQARVANWKDFITLEFDVFNPAKENVGITLSVTHRRTTGYPTRVEMPIKLKPGKNAVRLGIDEMVNVNGSTPDLANVGRWYFHDETNVSPTLFFGDIYLVGDDGAPAPSLSNSAGPVAGPAATYKITGKIGDMPVDLTATPIGGVIVPGVAVPQAGSSQAKPRATALLHVSRGQLPNDTGGEQTKYASDQKTELGGKCLRVDFVRGDSCGANPPAVKDWRGYLTLEFEVFHPGRETVRMMLTVKHKRTTSYQTRADVPFVVKPGKNSVKIELDEITNVNGSAPDLSGVNHWYINPEDGATVTLYFGDFWLLDSDATRPAPGASSRTAPAGGAPAGLIKSDPARLARIRAAKMPAITKPVMFCTPEADAICSALEVFPPDNPWNQMIEDWPLHPNSDAIITSIGRDKPFRCNTDMGFILVPPDQKRVDVKIVEYPAESDAGPFPVPDNVPIEGWPVFYDRYLKKPQPLEPVQRRPEKYQGDRHAIVVDPVGRMLYEFFTFGRTAEGWAAGQASVFDLKTNDLRPWGWTSSDAAGLPIFPAVVRYDEIQRGMVEHAMRVTVTKTRREFVAPATHYASPHENADYPRMGERIRLKADFDTSEFSPEVQAILKGLKKYGMFVADNGIDWAISIAPDPRIPDIHAELRKIPGAAFEVVVPPQ